MEERTLLSDVPVQALFNLDLTHSTHSAALTESPFPSNLFTKADDTQNTGREVNLPIDESTMSRADVEDTQVLNTLDGFNLQPRLSIPFDGLINPASVNSQDVFLVSLGDTLPHGDKGGEVVGINQVVWDPATTTLYVESDQLLDQHTIYALIVTNGVQDASNQPVQASEAFKTFRHDLNFGQTKDPDVKVYRKDLIDGMAAAAARGGVPESDIVTASVFTTMSATATLEKIRDQIHAAPAQKVNFNIGLNGERAVFNLGEVTNITLKQEITVGSPSKVDNYYTTLLSWLKAVPGKLDAVGQVAFGSYVSPDYEVHPGEYIPAKGVGTLTGTPKVQGTNTIYFTLYLPFGQEPNGGWPVAIFGQGASSTKDEKFGVPAVAATMAANGIATIGINTVGFGYGSLGEITVTQSNGSSVTFSAGGRGIDQNGNGKILNPEGFLAASPQAIISERDARIQTDADLMQLGRVIQAGVDVNNDKIVDLNPLHISYAGMSMGGMIGASFLAVEPDVSAGALGVLGGATIERLRLGSNRGGPGVAPGLTAANVVDAHGLLNGPGITKIDGMSVPKTDPSTYFNENMPLRDGFSLTVVWTDGSTHVITSPWTNGGSNYVPGAMQIQRLFDNYEWVSQSGDPVAYAPYLRKDRLPGVPAKSVLIQFAKGDPLPVNPTTTAFLRAGDLADRATYFRYDLAFPEYDQKPDSRLSTAYPHTFEGMITSQLASTVTGVTQAQIALAAQQQIAAFLASDGTQIIQPSWPGLPAEYFELLTKDSLLPEGLNFTIPVSTTAAAEAQVSGSLDSDAIPTGVATDTPNAVPLEGSLSTTSVPASSPPSRTVMPTSALVDLAIEALPPVGWIDSGPDIDDLAAGLLPHARRRR
jgi:hypothetical protein